MPKSFAGGGIECNEVPFGVASEDQPSCGGKNTRPRGRGMLPFPFDFAGVGIERAQSPVERFSVFIREIGGAIGRVPGIVRLRRRGEDVALLARRDVEESGLRVVGG